MLSFFPQPIFPSTTGFCVVALTRISFKWYCWRVSRWLMDIAFILWMVLRFPIYSEFMSSTSWFSCATWKMVSSSSKVKASGPLYFIAEDDILNSTWDFYCFCGTEIELICPWCGEVNFLALFSSSWILCFLDSCWLVRDPVGPLIDMEDELPPAFSFVLV